MSSANDSCRLSVALIVRDAVDALRETVASVRDMADELVVLDTGSNDASCEVAAELGARVVHHPWQDDFANARNACQKHVTGNWLLWLDAGERLSADEASSLRAFVKQEANPQTAYAILVHVPANGPGSAGEQVARIRLLPNNPLIQYGGRVRETVADSLVTCGINVDALPYRIRRGPREHEPQTKSEKARRNIRLSEAEIRERGVSANLLNCLGDAFQTLNDNQRAQKCFRHALSASPRGSVEMLEAYYGVVTSLDGDESNRETQLSLCVQALEVFPLDAQLLCAMGGHLHAQGRADLALKAYQTAYKYGQVNPVVWHVDEIREIAAICYSIALQADNRPEEALAILEEAREASPSCGRLRRHLLESYVKRGDRDQALRQLLVDWLAIEPQNPEAVKYLQAIKKADAAQAGDRHLRIDGASPNGLSPPASADLQQPAGESHTPGP
ncbi:MAG: glycosyltransferase [Pirellulaceae bacterium]